MLTATTSILQLYKHIQSNLIMYQSNQLSDVQTVGGI